MKARALLIGAAALALTNAAWAQHDPPQERRTQDQPDSRPESRQDAGKKDKLEKPDNRYGRTNLISGASLVPVDWILSSRVLGQDRDRLGEVNDLVISPADDRVLYALVEHGGLLGMGEHIIPVPWRTLEWDGLNRALYLPVTSERLSSAPTVGRNEWANLRQAAWRQRVDDFFDGKSMKEGVAKWQTAVRNGQPITIRGTIRDIDSSEPVAGMGPDRVLMIATENGDQKVIHIGPSWFVDRQRQMFREGQQVEVVGYSVDLGDNRNVIVTRTINTPSGTYRLRDDQGRPVWDLGTEAHDAAAPQPREKRDTGEHALNQDRDSDRNPDRPRKTGRDRDQDTVTIPGTDRDRTGGTLGAPGAEPALVKVSALKGQRVTDTNNDEVGRMNTIVFSPDSGKLAYAVVTVGGFLGIGDSKYAIPWKYFDIDQQGRVTTRQLDKETLRNAPKVESRNWSELQDEQFGRRVYEHFGLEPTWASGGPRGSDDDAMNRTSRERPATRDDFNRTSPDPDRAFRAGPDEFQQLFEQGEAVDLVGTVARLDYAGRGGIVDLVVRGPSGERTVKLAPRAYLDKVKLNLQEGQQVTVHGRQVVSQGQRVIVPQDIVVDGRTVELRSDRGSPAWRTPR